LNNLPTTTLSTTPHILHTRTTILIPPTSMPPPEDPVLGEARRVERAEKRLQTDSDLSEVQKKKENYEWGLRKAPVSEPDGSSQGVLESEAIDRYLEDGEWEEQERKEGRGLVIQKFPWGSFGQKVGPDPGAQQGSGGFKWPWST